MKKFILSCFALVLTLGYCACSSDDESVRKNGYDELPVWLVPQAEALAEEFKRDRLSYLSSLRFLSNVQSLRRQRQSC